ncbi:MAG TPA: Ig-like domain-containing protein, partial [Verrucomicrobiae bacterium]|nr:Ig-like domain-containing protein [Verrucomicrobiae bacterium]
MKGLSLFRPLCGLLILASFLFGGVTRSPAQASGPPIYPLTVTIVAPTNGAVFTAPADIQITADLKDYGAYPHTIAFYAGTNQLAFLILDPIGPSETNGMIVPVQFTWSNVPVGAYTLTAVATDTGGRAATSGPVNITVTSSTPPVPYVTIVATDPIASLSGDTGTFTVYRTGGSVSNSLNVFYNIGGTASNGVDYVTLPNSVTIPAGATSAQITVTPINDSALDGNETVALTLTQPPYLSAPLMYLVGNPSNAVVTILGNLPPTVSIVAPTNGASFTAPANIQILAKAAAPEGYVRTVEFFNGTKSLGIVTNHPIVVEPLVPAPSNGSTIYPINLFSLLWSNVLAGSYTLTAVATDSGGLMATSAPVSITINNNPPPPPPTNIP